MAEHHCGLVWQGPIAYDLGPDHPLKPLRVELAIELMRSYGLLDQPNVEILAPREATDAELSLIHSPSYIEAVRRAGLVGDTWASWPEHGLGTSDNPIFPDMHHASAEVVGGTLVAADFVLSGQDRHAFSIAGGLHHAVRDRASGFCIYNDASIGIEYLRRAHGLRVAYLDTDVHHGDGVQDAFYATDEVLTVSFHESGHFLFPGTGFVDEAGSGKGKGFAVNVPLPPHTGDEAYLQAFDALVPALLRAFEPDIIVNQNGADAHHRDPLAHLRASSNMHAHVASTVHQLSHELCEGRWLALGGGGYDICDAVPRAWTLVMASMLDVRLPQDIPDRWLEFEKVKGCAQPPTQLLDEPTPSTPREIEQVAAVVDQLRRSIPLLNG